METVVIITFGVVCFILGMYVTTQVSEWIDSRIQHKKFEENFKNFDNKKKK
jgi:small-conductance mechanosensitive channel